MGKTKVVIKKTAKAKKQKPACFTQRDLRPKSQAEFGEEVVRFLKWAFVPKARLSKYLKETIYSLDLASMI